MSAESHHNKRGRATYEEIRSMELKHARKDYYHDGSNGLDNFLRDENYDKLMTAEKDVGRLRAELRAAKERAAGLREKFIINSKVREYTHTYTHIHPHTYS